VKLTPARVTLLMLLVVGGLIIAYVAKTVLAREEEVPVEQTRNVPMPAADIEPGTLITEAHLGLGPARAEELPRDALLVDRLIVGRVARERLERARPILAGKLYSPGERPPLRVMPGKRAVTVIVGDNAQIVDGLIQPGSFIDLHLTAAGTGDERLRGGTTVTVFKGIKVLALNQSTTTSPVDRGGNTATLELTPEQANIAILAGQSGSLTLTLNPDGPNGTGVHVGSENRATLEEILNLPPVKEPEPPFATEQFRGTDRTLIEFGRDRQSTYRTIQKQPKAAPNTADATKTASAT
jgi:pilus assembly protein CpaB